MKYFRANIQRVNINSVRCYIYCEESEDGKRLSKDISKHVSLKIVGGKLHDKLLSTNGHAIISVENGILRGIKER
jgi:hypothetical protein